jgi:hypothetical protein
VTFHQGENADDDRRFLQIVAKPRRRVRKKTKAKPEPKLTRVAFRVPRLMEFCTERELQNQTGHSFVYWPLVLLKELVDNALDASEEAEVAPEISIAAEKRFKALLESLPQGYIFAGEIVCLDETGRPISNDLLFRRREAVYLPFDVLSVEGARARDAAEGSARDPRPHC